MRRLTIVFKLRMCREFDLREYKAAQESKLLFENTHTLIERQLKRYTLLRNA